jgi:patatin-like phospholipase/acyl hydrolase
VVIINKPIENAMDFINAPSTITSTVNSNRPTYRQAKSTSQTVTPSVKTSTQKVRILSIDGGGIRGVIPATILNYLEKTLQNKSGNLDARLCDYFDLIAGTSTGGILTCCYLNPMEDGRPMTAEKALDLYMKQGGSIFELPFSRKVTTLFGATEEKYSSSNMERIMQEAFGTKTRLDDFVKPCLISSYDITDRKAVFFNQQDAKQYETRNFKVWEVARATSAAPIYFEPALVENDFGQALPLVDGGLFANNPAMCAFVEAHKTAFSQLDEERNMPDYPLCSDIMMVSLSTGSAKEKYKYETMKNKGMFGWIKPIIDIMMSASGDTVDYQLQKMFDTCNELEGTNEKNYYRLNPDLRKADPTMDNASEENLNALHRAGLQYIAENHLLLDEIIDKLLDDA